jgi:hypothetical protein
MFEVSIYLGDLGLVFSSYFYYFIVTPYESAVPCSVLW